jgi:DNA repair protein RadA
MSEEIETKKLSAEEKKEQKKAEKEEKKARSDVLDRYNATEMSDISKRLKQLRAIPIANPREAYSSKNKPKLLTHTVLDDVLGNGGITADKVIELYGEYGVGKTQICNTLMAEATQPTPESPQGGTVVLINNEHTFSTERIEQIIEKRGLNLEMFWKNIIIFTPEEWIDQIASYQQIPSNEELAMQGRPPLKLIVVDSLLVLLDEDDSFEGRQKLPVRSRVIRVHLLGKLKRIARREHCVILFTNQVQDVPDVNKYTLSYMKQKAKGGPTVSHVPDIVLYIRKAASDTRLARIMDSQELPNLERAFVIDERGINDVDESLKKKLENKTKKEEEKAKELADKTEAELTDEEEAESILNPENGE